MSWDQQEVCPKCEAPTAQQRRICATCGEDLGCPNVRRAQNPHETAALEDRFQEARRHAEQSGNLDLFNDFLAHVESDSSVVVAIPPWVALQCIQDEGFYYRGYEALVGAEIRSPAEYGNDQDRRVIAGDMFPSFGDQIAYGALSLDGGGLPTYGEIFFRLKPIAIKGRVSFLEENSYAFVKRYPEANKPEGYLSDWENRGRLAATKHREDIEQNGSFSSWNDILIRSDGVNRENDDFIEAHIFGPFNKHSVDSVSHAEVKGRDTKKMIDLVLELAAKNGVAA